MNKYGTVPYHAGLKYPNGSEVHHFEISEKKALLKKCIYYCIQIKSVDMEA